MNIYDKFLEEVGKIDHSEEFMEFKEEIIPRQYYDFLCDKTKEYYKLIEQQKPIIQHDEEVTLKTVEELFGKGIRVVTINIYQNDQYYFKENLGQTYLRSESRKGWFENIPEILIKSRRKIADPSTLPVDAHIQVKVDGIWLNRHFAKYENGEVYFWLNGRTSRTSNNTRIASEWRLPEGGEIR